MSYKKTRIFSIFVLLGIASLFVPVTALQNSIAMAQEYDPQYQKENKYYNQEYDQKDEENKYYNQEYDQKDEENKYYNQEYDQKDEENKYYNQEYDQKDEENKYYNQEYDQKDEENKYYNQEYDSYQSYEKNAPIVNVEKKLFICNDVNNLPDNVTDAPIFFECPNPANFFFPAGPDSDQYIPCNDEICQFINESNFSAQIFKDVATVRDLSPEGVPVNIDKFHYTVTEDEIDQRITTDDGCYAVGFDHFKGYLTLLENGTEVDAYLCVNYVGDCEGTIYSDEVKTCTVENYIFAAVFFPPPEPEDNSEESTNSIVKTIQPQTPVLRDIISDRTN